MPAIPPPVSTATSTAAVFGADVLQDLLLNAPGLVIIEERAGDTLYRELGAFSFSSVLERQRVFLQKYPLQTVELCQRNMHTLLQAGVRTLYVQPTLHDIDRAAFQLALDQYLAAQPPQRPEALIQLLRLESPGSLQERRAAADARLPAMLLLFEQARRYGVRVLAIDNFKQGMAEIHQHPPVGKFVLLTGQAAQSQLQELRKGGTKSLRVREDPSLRPDHFQTEPSDAVDMVLTSLPRVSADSTELKARLAFKGAFAMVALENSDDCELWYRSKQSDTAKRAKIVLKNGQYYLRSEELSQLRPAGAERDTQSGFHGQGFFSLAHLSLHLQLELGMLRVSASPQPGADASSYHLPENVGRAVVDWTLSATDVRAYVNRKRALYEDAARKRLPQRTRLPRPPLPELDAVLDTDARIARITQDVPFLVLGENHSAPWARQFMLDNLEQFARLSFDRIYVENLPTEIQPELDHYWAQRSMGTKLNTVLTALDTGRQSFPLRQMLSRATDLGIRVIAIDSVLTNGSYALDEHASYEDARLLATTDTREGRRQRLLQLNDFAASLIEREQRAPHGGKALVLVGSAHAHARYGIPGLVDLIPGRSLLFDVLASAQIRRNHRGLLAESAVEFEWLTSDYTVVPLPPALTPAQIAARLPEIDDFAIYQSGEDGVQLSFRNQERQIRSLPIQIDTQTEQFYLDQPLWRAQGIDQRRYDSLKQLSVELNRQLRMTPINFTSLGDEDLHLMRLRSQLLLAFEVDRAELPRIENLMRQGPGKEFALLAQAGSDSESLHYHTAAGDIAVLPLQHDGARVFIDQPEWAEQGVHLRRYRNEAALGVDLIRRLGMQALTRPELGAAAQPVNWATLLPQRNPAPLNLSDAALAQWHRGWANWKSVVDELGLSGASAHQLKQYLLAGAKTLLPRRAAGLICAIKQQQLAWLDRVAAGASRVNAFDYTQPVPPRPSDLVDTQRALSAHLAAALLQTPSSSRDNAAFERYLERLNGAVLSAGNESVDIVIMRAALYDWTFNVMTEHFGSSRPQSGVDVTTVMRTLERATQNAAYLLRAGAQSLVLGVAPQSRTARYTLIDPENGWATFPYADAMQQALGQFVANQEVSLFTYRTDLASRALFADVGGTLPLRLLMDAKAPGMALVNLLPDAVNVFKRLREQHRRIAEQRRAETRYTQQVTLQIGREQNVQAAAYYLHGKHADLPGRLLVYDPPTRQVELINAYKSQSVDQNTRVTVLMHGGDLTAEQLTDALLKVIPQDTELGRLALVGCTLQAPLAEPEGTLASGLVVDVLQRLKAQQRTVQSASVHTGMLQIDAAGRKWISQTTAEESPRWSKQAGSKLLIWPDLQGGFSYKRVAPDPYVMRYLQPEQGHRASGPLQLGPPARLGGSAQHAGVFPLLQRRLFVERVGAKLEHAVAALLPRSAPPDTVPLLHTLQAEPDGAWSMGFLRADSPDIVRYQSRDPALGADLRALKGFFDQLSARRPRPGGGLTEESSVDGLNFAFAIQSLLSWFNRRTRQQVGAEAPDGLAPNLALAIQIHDYVNLAQIGHGVLLDSSQLIRLVAALRNGESLAHTGFGQLFAKGGVAFQLVSVVLDGYALSQATTGSEKAVFGTQLAFDSSGLTLGVASLLGLEAAAPAGVILAGVGIGVTELVRIFSGIAERAAEIGRYMWCLKEAHRVGGFDYHAESKTLLPRAYAVITEIDLVAGVVGFGSAQIYPSSHRDSDGVIAHVIGWAARRPHIVYDRSRLLTIVDELGWSRRSELYARNPAAHQAEILVLPGVPEAVQAYDYNLLAGAILRQDAGFAEWDQLAQSRNGVFAFRFLCGFEYIIDKLKFAYRATALKVTLNQRVRSIVMPELPHELHGFRSTSLLVTSEGDYTVVLRPGSELVIADAPHPQRWTFDASQLDNDNLQFGDRGQLQIGGVRIRFDVGAPALERVLLINRQRETVLIDMTAQRSSVTALDVRQWQTPETLHQHLDTLASAHRFGSRYVLLEKFSPPEQPEPLVPAYYDTVTRQTWFVKDHPDAVLAFQAGQRVYFLNAEPDAHERPRNIPRPILHTRVHVLDAQTHQARSVLQIVSHYEASEDFPSTAQDRDALRRVWPLKLWQSGEMVFLTGDFPDSIDNQPVYRLEGDRLQLVQLTHADSTLLQLLYDSDSLGLAKLRTALQAPLAWGCDTLQGTVAELPASGLLLVDEHAPDDSRFLRRTWLQMPDEYSAAVRVLPLATVLDQQPWSIPADIRWVNLNAEDNFVFYSPSAQQLYLQAQRRGGSALSMPLPDKVQGLSYVQGQWCVTLENGLIYQLASSGKLVLLAVNQVWRKMHANGWWRDLARLAADETLSIMDLRDATGAIVPAWWCAGKVVIAVGMDAATTELAGMDEDRCSAWLYQRGHDSLSRVPCADEATLARAFAAEVVDTGALPTVSETIEGAADKLLAVAANGERASV